MSCAKSILCSCKTNVKYRSTSKIAEVYIENSVFKNEFTYTRQIFTSLFYLEKSQLTYFNDFLKSDSSTNRKRYRTQSINGFTFITSEWIDLQNVISLAINGRNNSTVLTAEWSPAYNSHTTATDQILLTTFQTGNHLPTRQVSENWT